MNSHSQRHYWLFFTWLAAAVAANVVLPRVLEGAARGAAARDDLDCHQARVRTD